MRNIKLLLEYDGTEYVGWQRQKNGLSIQEKIEESLIQILNENVKLISAGRTDAGVHAREQVVNFKTRSSLSEKKLKQALNSALPPDIRIKVVEEVNPNFHARYWAKRKVYRYYIYCGEVVSPFIFKYAWHLPLKLDFKIMTDELNSLKGRHNFLCFQAKGSNVKDTLKTVYRANLKKRGFLYQFEIEADGFLYKMVRRIVGTIIEVGRGKFAPGRIQLLFKGEGTLTPGPVAPAKGLFLWRVIY